MFYVTFRRLCSRTGEKRVLREFANETYEEILREFFSDFLKEDLVRNWELLDLIQIVVHNLEKIHILRENL